MSLDLFKHPQNCTQNCAGLVITMVSLDADVPWFISVYLISFLQTYSHHHIAQCRCYGAYVMVS